jgi:WD40 repeat protein
LTTPLFSETYRQLLTVRGHTGAIYSLAYHDGFIYSASADKFVTRWDLTTGLQDKFAIKFEDVPYCLTLLEENTLLSVGTNSGKLHMFDLKQRTELRCFQQHKSAIFSIQLNKSINHMYTADAQGNIAVWCTNSWDLLLFIPLNCGKIRRMRLDEIGARLFVAAQDGQLIVLDTEYFNVTNKFHSHQDGATSLMLASNDTLLFTGGKDALLKCWDLRTEKMIHALPAHNFVIYDILRLTENSFATVSRDKSIKIWNLPTLEVLMKIDAFKQGHHHSVNSIVKIDDMRFATCSDDKTIRVFGI